jgi:hypothetical protein
MDGELSPVDVKLRVKVCRYQLLRVPLTVSVVAVEGGHDEKAPPKLSSQ